MSPTPDPLPLTPDDPRVTAYALGEMSAEERAVFERAMEGNPAIRAAVDEIRAFAPQLVEALKDEPLEETGKVVYRTQRSFWGFPQAYYFIGFAAAACLAIFIETRPRPTVDYETASRQKVVVHEIPLSSFKVEEVNQEEKAGAVASAPVSTELKPEAAGKAQSLGAVVFPDVATLEQLKNPTPPESTFLPKIGFNLSSGAESQKPEPSLSLSAKKEAGEPDYAVTGLDSRLSGSTIDAFTAGGAAQPARDEFTFSAASQPGGISGRIAAGGTLTGPGAPAEPSVSFGTEPPREELTSGERQMTGLRAVAATRLEYRYSSLSELTQWLSRGTLPERGSINLRRVLDSVAYAYPAAGAGEAFSVSLEAAQEPWADDRVLVRIGFRSRDDRAVEAVRVHLAFDPRLYKTASTWGYHELSGDRRSIDIPVGEVPAGLERTVVVELVRRHDGGTSIGQLDLSAAYADGNASKSVDKTADPGSLRFADADPDFRHFGCVFRFAEVLNYRPSGSASAMLQLQQLVWALPADLQGASALASAAGRAASLFSDSTLLNGENRRVSPFPGRRL